MIRVLYVEDNEDNIYMLTKRLKKKSFEVLVAQNGQEGVDIALDQKPDIILMDLSLPIKDGWQAIEELKGNSLVKHIPIIALSAHAMDQHRLDALKAGAEDFDTKPVDLNRLLAKMTQLLQDASNTRETD